MTYATELSDEHNQHVYFARIQPKVKVTGFTLHSGDYYKVSFTLGPVEAVTIDGVSCTLDPEINDGSGDKYYYDESTSFLYVRKTGGGALTSNLIVVTYNLYYSTIGETWYHTPTDSATTLREWEPFLRGVPSIKQTLTDTFLGFQPVQSSNVEIDNSTHSLEPHVYDSSFSKASIKVWHLVGDISTANFALIYNGLCGNLEYKGETVSIQTKDEVDSFNQEFRTNSPGGTSDYFLESEFTGYTIDPQLIGSAKRRVFGLLRGFKLVNLAYDDTTTSESVNHKWGCQSALSAEGMTSFEYQLDSQIITTGGTTTRAYFEAGFPVTEIFDVGDGITLQQQIFSPWTQTVSVTAVASNYIDFTPAAPSSITGINQVVYLNAVPHIKIERSGVIYTASNFSHYTLSTVNGVVVATFQAGFAAAIGIPSGIAYSDTVWAKAYGKPTTATYSSVKVGKSGDKDYRNNMNAVAILYEILKSNVGLSESVINGTSFQDAITYVDDYGSVATDVTLTDRLSFAIPENVGEKHPKVSEVISKILVSIGGRLYKNENNQWTFKKVAAITTPIEVIDDNEFYRGSFSSRFEYDDVISDIEVKYRRIEKSQVPLVSQESFRTKTVTNNLAKYLHDIKKQKTFDTYLHEADDAQDIADTYSYIYGERQGRHNIKIHKKYFELNPTDEVTIETNKMPGFSYDEDTLRTRNGVIIDTKKDDNGINLIIDDQKGLEDNT